MASERGIAQTTAACCCGVVGPHLESQNKLKYLERYTIAGESPVDVHSDGREVS